MKTKIPEYAQTILDIIPAHFVDDGCSLSPDSVLCTDIRWACRIHDWRYCSRAHRPGRMDTAYRKMADKELRKNMGAGLPWYSQWIRNIYWLFVRRYGSGDRSFDSCGYEVGDYCRHNMPQPAWMRANQVTDGWVRTLEDV